MRVPDRKCEHAVETRNRLFYAPAHATFDDDFGVRLPPEHRAARNQFIAEIREVVALAVISDDEATIRREHRLVASRRKINNRKTAMAKCNARLGVDPNPEIVRPAVAQRPGHISTERESTSREAPPRRQRPAMPHMANVFVC